ncbi:ScbA/BarX family gamma-butyrolactone biosynthesis protein [Arthrobacter sp. R-11]|uniref:ScbA/BarX family gamma-butyrolactone biosynthesis protein n=1 Tax=Arthrobacter sp. R-11 TaxID=3404053 RepID=UPI003CED97BD
MVENMGHIEVDEQNAGNGLQHAEALFESSVGRGLVHKLSLSEVFLTDFVQLGPEHFAAGAQWPRWHVFYGSRDGLPDSALMAETLRQSVILLAHRSGVPMDYKFLMPRLGVAMEEVKLDPLIPTQLSVDLELRDVKLSAGKPAALTVDATFTVDGETIGKGSAGARIVTPAGYERFRRSAAVEQPPCGGPLLEASVVGHSTPRNVMLGEEVRPSVWPLRVDTSHPIFFDHPLDHVPGMLLIEAARQAVRAAMGRPEADFSRFEAEFVKIAELADPVELAVTLPGSGEPEASAEPGKAGQDSLQVRVLNGDEVLMILQAAVWN